MKVKKLNESFEQLIEEVVEETPKEITEEDTVLEEAVKDYRKMAGLEEGMEITGDLDEWALNEAAYKYNIPKYDLRHRLTEASGETLDDLAREQQSIIDEEDTRTDIERTLDRAYTRNKQAIKRGPGAKFQAVLFEGDAGVGKSNIVEQWAEEHGLTIHTIEAHTLNPEALLGIPDVHPTKKGMIMRRLSTELLEPLSKPNTVLFIDEYNRADYQTRFYFGNLAKYHTMPIPALGEEETQEIFGKYGQIKNGKLYFNNLIMVVGAQNPYGDVYTGTNILDSAELERFKLRPVIADPLAVLRYFRKKFAAEAQLDRKDGDEESALMWEGRLGLAEALLSSTNPPFRFSSYADRVNLTAENPNTKFLSPRSLEDALIDSDGTKKDLLDVWTDHCGAHTKNMVKTILQKYVDVKDKANDALKGGTKSSVFGGEDQFTLWDDLVKENPSLESE